MKKAKRRMVVHGAGLCAAALVLGCAPSADEVPAGSDLDALFAEVWDAGIERSGYLRLREGLPVERLDDLSREGWEGYLSRVNDWRERIDSFERESLEHSDWIQLRALEWDLRMISEGDRWYWHDSVLTPYSSPLPGVTQLLASLPLGGDPDDAGSSTSSYLELLAEASRFVGQLETHVRGQAERGVYVWRPNLPAATGLVRAQLTSGEGVSPFLPTGAQLSPLDDASRDVVLERARDIVETSIDPALESLLAFLEGPYADQTYEGVGALRLPEGEEYYRHRVRAMTTLDVTPEEIHERGLALVAEMEADMAALREATGFEGGRDAFRASLRSDPQYFPKSPDEVADRLMAAAESMESVIDQYFATRPEADYGVKRLRLDLEGSQTYGIYQPPTPAEPRGLYRYNGSKLDERSWLNLRAVSLHELVPGHHFHIARQSEDTSLPDYRRNAWHGAYTEGWGSYSSYLGLEAGVYEGDPLSAYGMYILEVFLANRLVVDPGMNFMGWTLEEGREYMREHTLESETQIASETLRYASDMPGQALAYQMGKLEILALREKAATALGETFDLRGFHEAILENGSLPLQVLREHIDWWIEDQRG